jgi:dTDP-4-amino-4,6-dideoxygalactose transaminase
VREHLASRGVGSEVYYPLPFHRQECFAEFVDASARFPAADAAAAEVLALPIYPELTSAQQEYVVSSLADALR